LRVTGPPKHTSTNPQVNADERSERCCDEASRYHDRGAAGVRIFEGEIRGAPVRVEVPAAWNGTLLWNRLPIFRPEPLEVASDELTRRWLLERLEHTSGSTPSPGQEGLVRIPVCHLWAPWPSRPPTEHRAGVASMPVASRQANERRNVCPWSSGR
jgi:hypothetical protein